MVPPSIFFEFEIKYLTTIRCKPVIPFYFRNMFAVLMRVMLDGSDGSTFNATTVMIVFNIYLSL